MNLAPSAYAPTIGKTTITITNTNDTNNNTNNTHTKCWAANPAIAAWAARSSPPLSVGGSGEGSVFADFVRKVVDTVHGELGKRPNMWAPLEWAMGRAVEAFVNKPPSLRGRTRS